MRSGRCASVEVVSEFEGKNLEGWAPLGNLTVYRRITTFSGAVIDNFLRHLRLSLSLKCLGLKQGM
jgi:hypothetical protein